MQREHWHQVRGYRRFYLVSDRGRVKSLHYGKERILKPGNCIVLISADTLEIMCVSSLVPTMMAGVV